MSPIEIIEIEALLTKIFAGRSSAGKYQQSDIENLGEYFKGWWITQDSLDRLSLPLLEILLRACIVTGNKLHLDWAKRAMEFNGRKNKSSDDTIALHLPIHYLASLMLAKIVIDKDDKSVSVANIAGLFGRVHDYIRLERHDNVADAISDCELLLFVVDALSADAINSLSKFQFNVDLWNPIKPQLVDGYLSALMAIVSK